MSAEQGSPGPQEHSGLFSERERSQRPSLESTLSWPLVIEDVASGGLRRVRHQGIILEEADDDLAPPSTTDDNIAGHREWLSEKLREDQP